VSGPSDASSLSRSEGFGDDLLEGYRWCLATSHCQKGWVEVVADLRHERQKLIHDFFAVNPICQDEALFVRDLPL